MNQFSVSSHGGFGGFTVRVRVCQTLFLLDWNHLQTKKWFNRRDHPRLRVPSRVTVFASLLCFIREPFAVLFWWSLFAFCKVLGRYAAPPPACASRPPPSLQFSGPAPPPACSAAGVAVYVSSLTPPPTPHASSEAAALFARAHGARSYAHGCVIE